jgi:hypothetical protein
MLLLLQLLGAHPAWLAYVLLAGPPQDSTGSPLTTTNTTTATSSSGRYSVAAAADVRARALEEVVQRSAAGWAGSPGQLQRLLVPSGLLAAAQVGV